jgi:hypothetical protein
MISRSYSSSSSSESVESAESEPNEVMERTDGLGASVEAEADEI